MRSRISFIRASSLPRPPSFARVSAGIGSPNTTRHALGRMNHASRGNAAPVPAIPIGTTGTVRAADQCDKPWFQRAHLPVAATGSLGENSHQTTVLKAIGRQPNARGTGRLPVNGHDVRVPQDPADDGNAKQRFPPQKTHGTGQGSTDNHGIEKTLMIHQQQRRAAPRGPFLTRGPERRNQTGQAKRVNALRNRQSQFGRSAPSRTVV